MRRLFEADAEALWHLRLAALDTDPQAFRETAEHHRATSVDLYRDRLRSSAENAVFGAFSAEILIGMAGVHRLPAPDSNSARIWGMFVLPQYRAKGVGSATLDAAIAHARTWAGVNLVELAVASSQESARHMYVRHGFVGTGITDDAGNERMVRPL